MLHTTNNNTSSQILDQYDTSETVDNYDTFQDDFFKHDSWKKCHHDCEPKDGIMDPGPNIYSIHA